jgi:hypothetical protein
MKFDSLEDKLEKYYNKLKNPSLVINNWVIVDIDAFNRLKKITLTSINNISQGKYDLIITAESKNNYIIIKHSPNFITTKVINTEYDYLLKDWDLISVDKDTMYKAESDEPNKLMSNKEIMKLLGFKLSRKAMKDLGYFS